MIFPKTLFESVALQDMRWLQHNVLKNKNFPAKIFAHELRSLEKQFRDEGNLDTFCREADKLADNLFNMKRDNFVGIIMSTLCKTNEFRPDALEYFAWKGFDIAKINRDFVHMIARLTDLKTIYKDNPQSYRRYLDVLFRQEHCLHKLTFYYDDLCKNYKTIHREIAPQPTYERMLAFVQTELGKNLKYTQPRNARYILSSASRIFHKNQQVKSAEYVDKLLCDIEKNHNKGRNFRRNFYSD